MKEKIVKDLAHVSKKDLLACFNGGKMDWVAVKKPRGVIIQKLDNGETRITIEMTQEQLNEAVEEMHRIQQQKKVN
ncbi:hypothetical protein [Prevotella sp. MA2016]|uniref:hypothetical protein n=1 Tax=Prevotella sp. MA2016 TaxID=1408310 RepID=UPI00048D4B46|nr:hypothetical protein [Prevotella sp. MA2016]